MSYCVKLRVDFENKCFSFVDIEEITMLTSPAIRVLFTFLVFSLSLVTVLLLSRNKIVTRGSTLEMFHGQRLCSLTCRVK